MASKVSGVIEYIQNENTKHAIAASAYGYCQTPANQSAKTVEMTNFILNEGVTVHIKFQYNNTASNPTLNINNTGAKSIVIYGTTKAGTVDNATGWHEGAVISFTYDGTNWVQSTSGIDIPTPLQIGAVSQQAELLTTNPFAPQSLQGPYISKIDNSFYAADKRWHVTATNLSSGSVSVLFDGSYETQAIISGTNAAVITMDFDPEHSDVTEKNKYFPGYPYGYILISFYSPAGPASISGRVYCNYQSQGVGWHNLTFSPISDNTSTNIVYRSEYQKYYNMAVLEITINGNTNNSYGYTSITQIEMHLSRPDSKLTPFLSKYGPETLYYDLTAPNFIGALQGTAATATKLFNTPNNTTTFLRGDNTWSNTLFGSFYIGNLTNTDSNLISAQSNSGNITLYSTGYSNGTYGARGLGVSAKKNSQNEDVPWKDIITIDDNNNAIFYGITYNSPTGSALCLNSGSGGSIIFQQNGVSKIRLDQSGILRPETNSYSSLGSSDYKWNEIYANNVYGLLTIDHTAGSNQELRIKYNNTIDYWLGIGSDNVTYGLYDNKLNSGSWILSAGTNNTWTLNGNAATVSRATFGDANNAEHNANNIVSNGLYYYNSNGPSTTTNLFKSTDGAIYCQAYATNWVAQIAQDYRNGALAVRSNKNGVWQEWLSVPLMKMNIDTYDRYPSLLPSDGINNWIKIGTANTDYGLLPSQYGQAGNGHNYIGTSAWYWKQAYIDEIMTGNIYSTGMSSCNFGDPRLRHLTNLAYYESSSTSTGASFTGTIKIKLPNTTSNHVMMVLRIIVYDYNTNAGAELLVSGYTYNNETWYNYSASVVGSYTKGIRLAYDGTNYCVLLGTTNTTWNYSKVILEDVYSGYEEQPASGYSITLITSESGYTVTGQVNTLLRADNLLAKTINIWPQNLTNYCEGIRIHASSNGCCTIMLCGTDNVTDQGTSTNSWGMFNYQGNFYISRNGSSAATTFLKCENNVWSWNGIAGGDISGTATYAKFPQSIFVRNISGKTLDANSPVYTLYSDYGSANRVITNMPYGWNYGSLLTIGTEGAYNGSLGAQFAWDVLHGSADAGRLWFRTNGSGGGTNGWKNWARVWIQGDAVTGAVWNDYAENRVAPIAQPGQVLTEVGDDTLIPTTKRLQHFAGIVSDTWGFSQGETDIAKTPIAVAGRVLAYPYRNRDKYKPGDPLCAAPNGTVDIMTREEVRDYPDRIVGTVSCVPDYEEWGGGPGADREPVKVNGRIWVKVK